ncbi:hypothetical protein MPTK1_3g03030 [Marchantia polymorpha subsp. ruderalis]
MASPGRSSKARRSTARPWARMPRCAWCEPAPNWSSGTPTSSCTSPSSTWLASPSTSMSPILRSPRPPPPPRKPRLWDQQQQQQQQALGARTREIRARIRAPMRGCPRGSPRGLRSPDPNRPGTGAAHEDLRATRNRRDEDYGAARAVPASRLAKSAPPTTAPRTNRRGSRTTNITAASTLGNRGGLCCPPSPRTTSPSQSFEFRIRSSSSSSMASIDATAPNQILYHNLCIIDTTEQEVEKSITPSSSRSLEALTGIIASLDGCDGTFVCHPPRGPEWGRGRGG